MFLKNAAWAVGALVMFAGISLAQTTAISGDVKGEDGKGLKDALIKIERKDIKGNYKVKTGKKGDYYYGGLPLGTYDVTCEVGGQDVDRQNGVRTRLGDPIIVNFDLQQIKARRDAMARAAETGQLTKEQEKQMSPEEKAAWEKANKERAAAMAKNKALNDSFNLGMTALQAKQFDQAIDAFKKAGELDPNQHVVWANLAESYVGLSNTKAGPDKDAALASSYENFQKAIALAPTNAGYHNNYALALARGKKFDEAQAELQKAAELDPPNAGKYYYNLGALLVNAGQYDPATEAFKKAIELTPNYAEAHYQYAVALSSKMTTTADGKTVAPPGMKEELTRYLELAPTGPNAEAAKAMLATLDTQLQTTYQNPNASPAKKSSKKK
ncbi:MAG: tetratricopeptide repeat protein [Acidobacteriota bacterium]